MPIDPNKLKAAISAAKAPAQPTAGGIDRSRLRQAISQAKAERPESGHRIPSPESVAAEQFGKARQQAAKSVGQPSSKTEEFFMGAPGRPTVLGREYERMQQAAAAEGKPLEMAKHQLTAPVERAKDLFTPLARFEATMEPGTVRHGMAEVASEFASPADAIGLATGFEALSAISKIPKYGKTITRGATAGLTGLGGLQTKQYADEYAAAKGAGDEEAASEAYGRALMMGAGTAALGAGALYAGRGPKVSRETFPDDLPPVIMGPPAPPPPIDVPLRTAGDVPPPTPGVLINAERAGKSSDRNIVFAEWQRMKSTIDRLQQRSPADVKAAQRHVELSNSIKQADAATEGILDPDQLGPLVAKRDKLIEQAQALPEVDRQLVGLIEKESEIANYFARRQARPHSQLDLPIGTGRGDFEMATPRPAPTPADVPPPPTTIVDPMVPPSVRSELGHGFPPPPDVPPEMPWPEQIHQASQGDLFTSAAIDVPPEVPVWGRPHEKAPTATPPTAGVLLPGKGKATLTERSGTRTTLNDPEATLIQSYPAKKMLAEKILRQRENMPQQIELIQKKLDKLSNEPPTNANKVEESNLRRQLREVTSKSALPREDADLLLREVADIEGKVPWQKLVRSYTDTYLAENPGKKKVPNIKPQGAEVTRRYGGDRPTRPRPTEETPDFPREVIKNPGDYRRYLKKSEHVLKDIGGPAARAGRMILRGKHMGEAEFQLRNRAINEAGLTKISDEQSAAADLALRGLRQPDDPAVQSVAAKGRELLDELGRATEEFSGHEGKPFLVHNDDGSFTAFKMRDDGTYAPEFIPKSDTLINPKLPEHQRLAAISAQKESIKYPDAPVTPEQMSDMMVEFGTFVRSPGEKAPPPKMVRYLMDRQGLTEPEAERVLRSFSRAKPREFGPLDYHRKAEIPFHEWDVRKYLPKYLEGGWKRLEIAKEVGQKGEKAAVELNRIYSAVSDPKRSISTDEAYALAKKHVDSMLSGKPETRHQALENMMSLVRTAVAFKITPRAAIANSTQLAQYGPLRTDLQTTLKALAAGTSKQGRQRAELGGAGAETAAQHLKLRDYGDTSTRAGRINKKVSEMLLDPYFTWNGFSKTEVGQRVMGHHLGEHWVTKMADRLAANPQDELARREMQDLLIDPDTIARRVASPEWAAKTQDPNWDGGTWLTDREELVAGMQMSRTINFTGGEDEIPPLFKGAFMRTLWQFKTFMMGASRLSIEAFSRELKSGLYGRAAKNAAYMSLSAPMFGRMIRTGGALYVGAGAAGFDLLRGRDADPFEKVREEWSPYTDGDAFDVAAQVGKDATETGLFALATMMAQSAQYRSLESVAGAPVSAAAELAYDGQAAWTDIVKEQDPLKASSRVLQWSLKHLGGPLVMLEPFWRGAFDEYQKRDQGSGTRGRTRGRRTRSR